MGRAWVRRGSRPMQLQPTDCPGRARLAAAAGLHNFDLPACGYVPCRVSGASQLPISHFSCRLPPIAQAASLLASSDPKLSFCDQSAPIHRLPCSETTTEDVRLHRIHCSCGVPTSRPIFVRHSFAPSLLCLLLGRGHRPDLHLRRPLAAPLWSLLFSETQGKHVFLLLPIVGQSSPGSCRKHLWSCLDGKRDSLCCSTHSGLGTPQKLTPHRLPRSSSASINLTISNPRRHGIS